MAPEAASDKKREPGPDTWRPGHFPGFDWLRAGAMMAVVAWHTRLFPLGRGLNTGVFVDLYVFLLAVPCFFVMSALLFSFRGQGEWRYFSYRMERLVYLYVFWAGLWVVISSSGTGPQLTKAYFDSIPRVLRYLAGGGTGVFFFLFSLIIVTLLCQIFSRAPLAVLYAGLAVSLFTMGWIPAHYGHTNPNHFLTHPYSPLNFVAYAFAGLLTARWLASRPDLRGRFPGQLAWTLSFLTLFAAAVFMEWGAIIRRETATITAYTRFSVGVGSIAVFWALMFVRRPAPASVRFLADSSLGIYCLHPFVQEGYQAWTGTNPQGSLFYFVLVFVFSLVGTQLLRRVFARGVL